MHTDIADNRHTEDDAAWQRVWDPFVRLAHWTLAIAFFVAYFSEEEVLSLHVWAGYVVGATVLLRIIWGFVGPRHARFTDFVYRPGEVITCLIALLGMRGKRYVGHNPAGGAMVIALLVVLAGVVWSGLSVYAIEERRGPLVGIVATEWSTELVPVQTARADDDERDEGGEASEEFWEETHEVLANIALVMVILHVAGVLLASYVHRENLVGAMVTGRKRAQPQTEA